MKKIDLTTLTDNVFNLIGKEWLLITAGDKNGFNTMTASWGCIGWLWNRPVAVVFIRPERYTHLLAEQNDHFTLSFLGNGDEAREIYNLCGSKSGRDCDKIKESGLQPIETESGNIAFTQSRLTLECRKLYKDSIKPECFIDNSISKWYGEKGGYHDAYILEIVNAYTA
jgi:flavin reductase (DIM6/NTAB) family NADH-FMN oxidoreductase RutF